MTDILLESGTNELEIVEFYVNNIRYGVNVTKVEEVRYMPTYRKMPQTSDRILGFFNLRGKVIPIIDLPKILEAQMEDLSRAQIIVMHFNERVVGFLVERVVKIIRLSWTNIIPPPCSFEHHQVVGVIIEPGRERDLIQLIDFEKIMEDIAPSFKTIEPTVVEVVAKHEEPTIDRLSKKIWIAEDSRMIQQIVSEGLTALGYKQQRWFTNGAEAWDAFNHLTEQTLHENVHLLISDIEMPQMDGLHLVKRLKEHTVLRQIPVIMFSSLINENTIHKCRSVGADEQVAKPEVEQLAAKMDHLLQRYAHA